MFISNAKNKISYLNLIIWRIFEWFIQIQSLIQICSVCTIVQTEQIWIKLWILINHSKILQIMRFRYDILFFAFEINISQEELYLVGGIQAAKHSLFILEIQWDFF